MTANGIRVTEIQLHGLRKMRQQRLQLRHARLGRIHRPPNALAYRQPLAHVQRLRTHTRQRVGGTAAQHRLHRKAAAYRQIAAQTPFGRTHGQHIARLHGQRHMAFGRQRHTRRILQIQRPGRPRHRHHRPGQSPHRETAMQQLDDRGIGLVAQQLVGRTKRRGIQRPGRRHALACLPRATGILEQRLQAGGHHLEDMRHGLLIAGTAGTRPITSGIISRRHGTGTHRVPAAGIAFGSGRHASAAHQRTPLLHDLALQRLAFLGRHIHELHALPRLQQRRRCTRQIPHRHVGGTNELPPPGRGTRVHGTEGTGQPDRARRNARARAGATRHVEYRIAP